MLEKADACLLLQDQLHPARLRPCLHTAGLCTSHTDALQCCF